MKHIWLASLTFLLCPSLASSARPVPKDLAARAQGVEVLVCVYDYAGVSENTLRRSEAETTGLLGQVGIRVAWASFPTKISHENVALACDRISANVTVNLRILPRTMSRQFPVKDIVLGFSLPPERDRPGDAWIFLDRVETLARFQIASACQILGVAMAHEIGHLMASAVGHSYRGLMCARWGREELQLAAKGLLRFAPEDHARIRRASREKFNSTAGK